MPISIRFAICGLCAGAVTGLLGAGGGMILVPLLSALTPVEDDALFPCSVAIILPLCIVSAISALPFPDGAFRCALPYLLGSCCAGLIAARIGKRIPAIWLHRVLGVMILWGGIRYLC